MRVLITPVGPKFHWAVLPPCVALNIKSFGDAPTHLDAAKAAVAYAGSACRVNEKESAPSLQEVMACR
jgi:hypothetical protein